MYMPRVVQKAASNMTLSDMKIDDNPEQEEWINRKLHSPWVCAIHQYGRQNSDMRKYDSRDIAECSPITSDCLQPEKGNCLSHAVCDDSVALTPLIQIIRALFSDDGDTAGRSGRDTDDGGSPGWTIRLFTMVFVLAVEFTRDDAMSGEDQGTVRKHINLCDNE